MFLDTLHRALGLIGFNIKSPMISVFVGAALLVSFSLLLTFSFLSSTRSVTRTGKRLGVGLLIGVVVVACGYGVFGSVWEESLTVLFIELLKYSSSTLLVSMLLLLLLLLLLLNCC